MRELETDVEMVASVVLVRNVEGDVLGEGDIDVDTDIDVEVVGVNVSVAVSIEHTKPVPLVP